MLLFLLYKICRESFILTFYCNKYNNGNNLKSCLVKDYSCENPLWFWNCMCYNIIEKKPFQLKISLFTLTFYLFLLMFVIMERIKAWRSLCTEIPKGFHSSTMLCFLETGLCLCLNHQFYKSSSSFDLCLTWKVPLRFQKLLNAFWRPCFIFGKSNMTLVYSSDYKHFSSCTWQ